MPIAIVARQSRRIETEHEPRLAETDLGDEALKAVTRIAGGPRLAEIFVDDLDSIVRPSQARRAADKTILQLRALLVLTNLSCRRLPNIDIGELGAMRRCDRLFILLCRGQ